MRLGPSKQQLVRPYAMTPMVDSLSPSFYHDCQPGGFVGSSAYFCADLELPIPELPAPTAAVPANVLGVLVKPEEERSAAEKAVVYKYLLQFNFFKEMNQRLSPQVTKQVIREGKPTVYFAGDMVSTCGRKVKTVRILLQGAVGILLEQTEGQDETEGPAARDLWQTLDLLVDKLGREGRNFKTKCPQNKKLLKESTIIRGQAYRYGHEDHCERTIREETFLDYCPLTDYEPNYSQTLVVTEDSTLVLALGIDEFYDALLGFHRAKQQRVIQLFRNVPIFNSFDNCKLKFLVERLRLVEVRKNEFVYREGQQPACFYLLTEGQVELTKTIEILAENPNNLYKNRVMLGRQRLSLNIKALPYANFSGVYNYQKESKLVSLALINPISLFGEEELIELTPRQVNARVLSLTAKMYAVSLADIEEFCGRVSGQGEKEKRMTGIDFLALLEDSLTMKKILFRQQQLAQQVNQQNRSKYKELYDHPSSPKHVSGHSSKATLTLSSSVTARPRIRLEEEAPPTINNFNFTEFSAEAMSQSCPPPVFTSQEARVVRLTHTKCKEESPGRPKQKQAIRMRNQSGQCLRASVKSSIDQLATIDCVGSNSRQTNCKSSQKYRITLDEPLFALKYFKMQAQLEKRLVGVAKKAKLECIYRKSIDKRRCA